MARQGVHGSRCQIIHAPLSITDLKSGAFQLQERDFALLRALFESRIMTSAHIATLCFEGRQEAAKKRLQKLKAAGLVAQLPRRVTDPSILYLTGKAFDVLRRDGHLTDFPALSRTAFQKRARVSEFTLRHELEVMDVKSAFHSAVRANAKLKINEFSTWPILYQFDALRPGYNGAEVAVKPDGFIRIHEQEADGRPSEHAFFLEVDRSTETEDFLVARIGAYRNYFKSGSFAVRNGGARDRYQEFPFRVLITFKTEARRNNCAERLLRISPSILSLAWLTTHSEVTANPLGAIWVLPADYRKAMREMRFDFEQQSPIIGYRRNFDHERKVERTVKKRHLFDV